MLIISYFLFRVQNYKFKCLEPDMEQHFLPVARADPIGSELESAPGPRTSGAGAGATQKRGSSATRVNILQTIAQNILLPVPEHGGGEWNGRERGCDGEAGWCLITTLLPLLLGGVDSP